MLDDARGSDVFHRSGNLFSRDANANACRDLNILCLGPMIGRGALRRPFFAIRMPYPTIAASKVDPFGKSLAIWRDESRDRVAIGRSAPIYGLWQAIGFAAEIDKRSRFRPYRRMRHFAVTKRRALRLMKRGGLYLTEIAKELRVTRETLNTWAADANVDIADCRLRFVERELLRTDPNRGGGEDRGKREVERRYARTPK